jgi:hypothetical protein
MHGRRMQDLPYDPEATLTREQMEQTRLYCVNDLDATELLFNKLSAQIDLRIAMGKEYGLDLRSKSEAQLAEAVIVKRLEKMTGERPQRPTIKPGTVYRYKVPPYVAYELPQLRSMLDQVRQAEFVVAPTGSIKLPKELEGKKITIGSSVYRMGIGGLHSSEESVCHIVDEDILLLDRDVTSYYPSIILTLGLHPKHLGSNFLKVYKRIFDERIAAKNSGQEGDRQMISPSQKMC